MVEERVADILGQWRGVLGADPGCEVINEARLFCRVTAAGGAVFILKEVGDIERRDAQRLDKVETDLAVLQHLAAHGVPVAQPVPTDAGRLYVQVDSRFYTLSPLLPAGFDEACIDLHRLYHNLGAAIGRLHRALAVYPGEIHSWQMDLPRRILEEAVLVLEQHLDEAGMQRLAQALAPLREAMQRGLCGLPVQPVHGDCHGGNVLFDGERVSGFIDLDHLPVGPRVWDLGYFLADWVKDRYQTPGVMETWFTLVPDLLRGYETELALSPQEREAVAYVMLGTQLIFAAYFFDPLGRPEAARFNLDAFYWIAANVERIQEAIRA